MKQKIYSQILYNHEKSYALYEIRPNELPKLFTPLIQKNAKNLIESIVKVNRIDFLIKKKEEVEFNAIDYFNFFNAYTKSKYDDRTLFIHTNRHFLNFLNSWRIYIDFLEIHLKKNYPINLPEYTKFKSFLFDSNFSYRFLYHLRNFAEHDNYPIFALHSENNSDFSPIFEKNIIFSNNQYFKPKHFAFDIRTLNDTFPVKNQIEEGLKLLQLTQNKFIEIIKYELLESIENIKLITNNKHFHFAEYKKNQTRIILQEIDMNKVERLNNILI